MAMGPLSQVIWHFVCSAWPKRVSTIRIAQDGRGPVQYTEESPKGLKNRQKVRKITAKRTAGPPDWFCFCIKGRTSSY